jgi:hypothetical protein
MPYPYSFIEDWWGESLSPELQQRIKAAPKKQLAMFRDDLHGSSDGITKIPPRPDGILRPALISPLGPDWRPVAEWSLSTALNILLYAHEIVIDTPLGSDEVADIPLETGWLLAVKPLADAGIMRLGHIKSLSAHPSRLQPSIERIEAVIRQSNPEFDFHLAEGDLRRLMRNPVISDCLPLA